MKNARRLASLGSGAVLVVFVTAACRGGPRCCAPAPSASSGALAAARTIPAAATYNADVGWHSASMCEATYARFGCDGIRSLFDDHPIPIGAVDEVTGRIVLGSEVVCDDATLLLAGVPAAAPEDSRNVPRGFGRIVLRYRPN